jgi:hypothetical protein
MLSIDNISMNVFIENEDDDDIRKIKGEFDTIIEELKEILLTNNNPQVKNSMIRECIFSFVGKLEIIIIINEKKYKFNFDTYEEKYEELITLNKIYEENINSFEKYEDFETKIKILLQLPAFVYDYFFVMDNDLKDFIKKIDKLDDTPLDKDLYQKIYGIN